jgi:hypothetical protein
LCERSKPRIVYPLAQKPDRSDVARVRKAALWAILFSCLQVSMGTPIRLSVSIGRPFSKWSPPTS